MKRTLAGVLLALATSLATLAAFVAPAAASPAAAAHAPADRAAAGAGGRFELVEQRPLEQTFVDPLGNEVVQTGTLRRWREVRQGPDGVSVAGTGCGYSQWYGAPYKSYDTSGYVFVEGASWASETSECGSSSSWWHGLGWDSGWVWGAKWLDYNDFTVGPGQKVWNYAVNECIAGTHDYFTDFGRAYGYGRYWVTFTC